MVLTIRKIRERLGELTRPIFFTDDFKEKYDTLSRLPEHQTIEICEKNHGLAMAYLHAIVSHCDIPDFSLQATQAVTPEVILTTYTTYWIVTQTLIEQDQKRKLSVPDSDADFLLYMFGDFLGAFEALNDSQ